MSIKQLLRNYSYMLIKEREKLELVNDSTREDGSIEFYNDEIKRIKQALEA